MPVFSFQEGSDITMTMKEGCIYSGTSRSSLHNSPANLVDHLHLGNRARTVASSTLDKTPSLSVAGIVNANSASCEETALSLPAKIGPIFSAILLSSEKIAVVEEFLGPSSIVQIPPTGDKLHICYELDELILIPFGELVFTNIFNENPGQLVPGLTTSMRIFTLKGVLA